MTTKGSELVCNPAVKYKFLKKQKVWCRTWFTIEAENKATFFRQRNAFHKDKNADWDKWQSRMPR